MLYNDYTSVPSWQAYRDRRKVLTPILDLDLCLWAYCYGLKSYPRSHESFILYHSTSSYYLILLSEEFVSILAQLTTMKCVQVMCEMLQSILDGECRKAEQELADQHSRLGVADKSLEMRGFRPTVTDNASAAWKRAQEADCMVTSHFQTEFGYGLSGAAARDAAVPIVCAATEASVASIFAGKKVDAGSLLSAAAQEAINKHVAHFAVSSHRDPVN
jgi:hypothetical protein